MVTPVSQSRTPGGLQAHAQQADQKPEGHADHQGQQEQPGAGGSGTAEDQEEVILVDGDLAKVALEHALDVVRIA